MGNRYSSEEAKRMYHGTGGGILGFIALHGRRLIAGTGSDRQAGMGTKERSIYISDVFATANKYADYFLWIDDASQLSDVAACERKAKSKIVLEIATFQSFVVRKKSQKKKNDYFRLVDTDTVELVALWFRADEISSSTYKGTDEYYLKTTALLPSIHSKGLSIHVGIQPDRLRN